MISGKPLFSSPMRWSTGTRTSSSSMNVDPITLHVSDKTEASQGQIKALTTRMNSRIIHPSSCHPRSRQRNHKQANTTLSGPPSPHRSGTIVSPYAIGNPFLCPINDIEISFAPRRRRNTSHIRSSYHTPSVYKNSHDSGDNFTNHQAP